MEATFDNRLNEISEAPGVLGVLCSDHQGLCLGVRGKAVNNNCGLIANIANLVSEIEPQNEEEPVILLDSNNL
ncbi:Ragulator complex protein LAMTOR5 [Armadillidium nasatum]|uniref:Late endosomal/lysosomal adaptor and MAPK and MTOR activator 5 n=1 Tax=Armadillidium nasatum TaxID=96803 RepID=A0A5N5T192_9CRUS|nr:Ragulator complex protein LAMTOR5 [Armadillidium nasatum]